MGGCACVVLSRVKLGAVVACLRVVFPLFASGESRRGLSRDHCIVLRSGGCAVAACREVGLCSGRGQGGREFETLSIDCGQEVESLRSGRGQGIREFE